MPHVLFVDADNSNQDVGLEGDTLVVMDEHPKPGEFIDLKEGNFCVLASPIQWVRKVTLLGLRFVAKISVKRVNPPDVETTNSIPVTLADETPEIPEVKPSVNKEVDQSEPANFQKRNKKGRVKG